MYCILLKFFIKNSYKYKIILYNTTIMDELEIISKDKNKKTLLTLSIEELENYQLELLDMIDLIKKEIEKRKIEIKKAEGFFKKK